MQIELVRVTPAKAKQWLTTLNTKNRKLRDHRVSLYANQMERDQWLPTGDTIKFDTTGSLVDGQHRLAAMVAANKTYTLPVVRNLPPEAFAVLDNGMGRTPGDALGREVKAASHKAASIRLLIVYEAGFDPRKAEPKQLVSKIDVANFYEANQTSIDEAYPIASKLYESFAGGNRGAWLAFVYLAQTASPTHVVEFIEGVLTGENLSRGDVRLALRNWLGNGNSKPTAGHHLGMIIKAWNAWMRGESRTSMMFRDSEEFPQLSTRRRATVKPAAKTTATK